MVKTLSSREFNQNTSDAKKLASHGPVIITDRGQPAHVLLSIEEYHKITGSQKKISDLLAMPGTEDIEFETPRQTDLARPADLS